MDSQVPQRSLQFWDVEWLLLLQLVIYEMRASTSTPLGLTVWHTRAYDVRQGLPVYQQSVGRPIPSTGNKTTSHHGISSPV